MSGQHQPNSSIALQDGNNFYCSVEASFDPRLRGRPVCVASSGDGCVIARDALSKKLDVPMGAPIHQIPPNVRWQITFRSANFALYGDISTRIASILRDLFPAIEQYSIDENFIDLAGIPSKDHERLAAEARARILKWTGIPSCVGIGPTKTLAKLSNKRAKSTVEGVVTTMPDDPALLTYPVEDDWGVGRKLTARLGADGILTAGDLAAADVDTLRSRYGVVMARTQRELQGISCADLEEHEAQRKEIMVSRTFGKDITSQTELMQAIATFAQRACEKLRSRQLQAAGVWVFIQTNPFKQNLPQYNPSKSFRLLMPSADTREILMVAQGLAKAMFRPGYGYKKAGVSLLDLIHMDVQQGDLFAGIDQRSKAIMEVMDRTNQKFGRGSMGFAFTAWRPSGKTLEKPAWSVKRDMLSPAYTTDWKQLIRVR
ncbi:TPA: Y-family DNA polymerase [Stenotrophomonas maltophilia]